MNMFKPVYAPFVINDASNISIYISIGRIVFLLMFDKKQLMNYDSLGSTR